MARLVVSKAGRVQALNNLIAAGKLLGAVLTCHLFQNGFAPNVNTVLGDYLEATFNGYLPITPVTWGAVYLDGNGNANVSAQTMQYEATDGVVENTIYGYYMTQIVGSLAPTLQYGVVFDDPVPVNYALAAVVFTPVFFYGQ